MVYVPSTSVDVATRMASPTRTTTDAPGSTASPLLTRPTTRHRAGAVAAGGGCGGFCPWARAPTANAANVDQPRVNQGIAVRTSISNPTPLSQQEFHSLEASSGIFRGFHRCFIG
jgi:hypothetical protein